MTPQARAGAIIELYDAVLLEQKPSDQILQNYFRQRKYIGSKDRKFIAETLYDLLRNTARLRWTIAQAQEIVTGRSVLLAALVFLYDKKPNDIAELFDGGPYAPQELDSEDTAALRKYMRLSWDDPRMDEASRAECPAWAYDGLKKQFPKDFMTQMQALQQPAPLDLRVNTLKGNRAEMMQRLRDDDLRVRETLFSPLGIRVDGRPAFSMHPLYQQGHIEVQDEGSQLLALLTATKPSQTVVDFCAGAGGKTMALAAMMQNKGRLWACDVDASRLDNARKRLRRAGVHCVETVTLDDERDDWVRKHAEKADVVLVDAPCSGMGTWRRNPFARWQDLGPTFSALTTLQHSILHNAARLVKKGGTLVYATCSLLPQENQDQVTAFMEQHPDFKPLSLRAQWQSSMDTPMPQELQGKDDPFMLQLTPATHDTDGFFVAALQRM